VSGEEVASSQALPLPRLHPARLRGEVMGLVCVSSLMADLWVNSLPRTPNPLNTQTPKLTPPSTRSPQKLWLECIGSGFMGSFGVPQDIPNTSAAYTLHLQLDTIPAMDTHWLEGVSDIYPTRVADTASSDLIFLNSKDLKALDRRLLTTTQPLFEW
jgi:hypothetical protein